MANIADSNLNSAPGSRSPDPSFPDGTGKNPSASAVWITVLHWRGAEHTRACLASLRGLSFLDYRVLLIDNGSPDQSGAGIAHEFPEVELLNLDTNLGFAGGSNAGINYCIERGAQWIWLLNNDTKVDPDSLELLMQHVQLNTRAGAAGAVVYTGGGTALKPEGPGEIDFRKAKTFLKGQIPAQNTVACHWLSGCNLLLRVEAINQIGMFDEDYFLYFEDTDLCHRLVKNDWECLFVPSAKIQHIGGASTTGARSVWRAYYYTRNRFLFFGKHLHGLSFVPAMFSIYGHLLRHALVMPFRGSRGRNQLRAEYLGWRDYVGGKLGKASCLDWCEDQSSPT